MTLLSALDLGLCDSSLLNFYFLSRSIVSKNEADFDKFDMAFAQYFEGVETPEDLPDEVWKWLNDNMKEADLAELMRRQSQHYDLEELMKRLEERLKEQTERHDGGSYWIGTGGSSPFGHGGYYQGGIRIGGHSMRHSAVKIAGERKFRDFREDAILDTRQFQMALRKLRQFSTRTDSAELELDMEETVRKTGDNAGVLKLVFQKPRRNTVKLLVLFDSDGSMRMHSELCASLFQAINKSDHFKDLKIYYFHNCIYDHLYKSPYCRFEEWDDTNRVLRNLSGEYKVIIVGDAYMAPSELMSVGGNISYYLFNNQPGIEWLKEINKNFPNSVWLNPIPRRYWVREGVTTIDIVKKIFPMYELTLDGLDAAVKRLL